MVARDPQIVGFTWGFQLPTENQPGRKFAIIRKELQQRGIDPEQTFYGAETGVVQKRQRKGVGTKLLEERIRLTNQNYVVFRTVNPNMVKVYEKAVGKENIDILCQDPDYPQRTWYLVHLLPIKKVYKRRKS